MQPIPTTPFSSNANGELYSIDSVAARVADYAPRYVTVTGGEPLVRKDIPGLASRLAALPGIEDLSLSTNAVGLIRYAPALQAAGVDARAGRASVSGVRLRFLLPLSGTIAVRH